jgi:DNA-binding LytR/AlgR family response regulator
LRYNKPFEFLNMNAKPLIELPTPVGTEFIKPEVIISIRAIDKFICLNTDDQKERLIRMSIGKAEKLLNYPFFVRCHRSHIINILKIKELQKKLHSIKLEGDIIVPISDSCKKNFEQVLRNYCEKWGGVNC